MGNSFVFHDSVNITHEWYTPKHIFDKLGVKFDLDPATSELANETVNAKNIYTVEDNGLEQSWFGKVWLNPPYGTQTGHWLKKGLDECYDNNTQIIALVFARTDVRWFHDYAIKYDQICMIKGRIKFVRPETMTAQKKDSGSGSLLLSIGADMNKAVQQSGLGHCVRKAVQ